MDINEFNEFMATSNRRARSGRRTARWMLCSSLLFVATPAILSLSAPNTMGGGLQFGPVAFIVFGTGILGMAIGLTWMIRILRADPEPDAKAWRYRGR